MHAVDQVVERLLDRGTELLGRGSLAVREEGENRETRACGLVHALGEAEFRFRTPRTVGALRSLQPAESLHHGAFGVGVAVLRAALRVDAAHAGVAGGAGDGLHRDGALDHEHRVDGGHLDGLRLGGGGRDLGGLHRRDVRRVHLHVHVHVRRRLGLGRLLNLVKRLFLLDLRDLHVDLLLGRTAHGGHDEQDGGADERHENGEDRRDLALELDHGLLVFARRMRPAKAREHLEQALEITFVLVLRHLLGEQFFHFLFVDRFHDGDLLPSLHAED